MLSLLSSGKVQSDDTTIAKMREAFATQHCVVLRHFLDAGFVKTLRQRLDIASFQPGGVRENLEREVEFLLPNEDPIVMRLILSLNRPALFDMIRQITDCPPIGGFWGRLYRRYEEHYYPWHNDSDGNRLVGFTINLSTETYQGGGFEMREMPSKRICYEVSDTTFGDAHLFRIEPEYEHRVAPVEGGKPRTVYAGWFHTEPDYRDMLKPWFIPASSS
ncbi:MAG: 2OG-Fe(II) oxygenase [Candidatus Tectomicrobia bacterium]|nr:2OG-Fe(II) oxygenase [Candidatus Tectomicrobia bacterium]